MTEATQAHSLTPDEERGLREASVEEAQAAKEVLQDLFSLLRTAAYHDASNEAMVAPSEAFSEKLKWLIDHEEDRGAVVVGQGQAYVGSIRIRISVREKAIITALEEFFATRKIGGLSFATNLTPQQAATLATMLAGFNAPIEATDAAPVFNEELEKILLDTAVEAVPPMFVRSASGYGNIEFSTETGAVINQIARGYGMLTMAEDSPARRRALKQLVRSLSEIEGEMLDTMIGLTLMAAVHDIHMRSLVACIVAMHISRWFSPRREVVVEIGEIAVGIADYDRPSIELAESYGRPLAGAAALRRLYRIPHGSLSAVRATLSVASRYFPPEESGFFDIPTATRSAEILRAALDWADLCVPTRMYGTERFLEPGPLPPPAALAHMLDMIDVRYTPEVFAATVNALGLLPMGTIVRLVGERLAIVVKRTGDPLSYVVREVFDPDRGIEGIGPEKPVAIMNGPDAIVSVTINKELLPLRSKVLIGADYNRLETAAMELYSGD